MPIWRALEWEPLLALVAGFAASPVGRAAILALRPSTDEEWITRQHQLTGEVRLAAQRAGVDCAGRAVRSHGTCGEGADSGGGAGGRRTAGRGAAGERHRRMAGIAAVAAGAAGGQAAGFVGDFRWADAGLAAAGRGDRAQDSAGWDAGRRCIAGAGAHSPRAGAAAAGDRGDRCGRRCASCRAMGRRRTT